MTMLHLEPCLRRIGNSQDSGNLHGHMDISSLNELQREQRVQLIGQSLTTDPKWHLLDRGHGKDQISELKKCAA
jgi:hypothetical protein